ncbi:lysylphosphatidylglycerol synthase transmembrane domain-containing protein [Croceitalea rosinachiae]|uniref:Lysylphosphatidylglycerol synthase transmembrane domain-containing protein n=1 Tax=Croceitalea rosinachiae TaxID=3075596 RepID=A0ABU3ABJ4_9FLAO|nr:lysylphosphatidylglycerol synthase transmembrane domain-containing protein [Croceitalea sp. F388]MDT0606932.1 lysylphosphatidylglycerol synthase transmembrane domain-containing protein [Croceitalea sp. F388]
MTEKQRKLLTTTLKIVVSALLIYFIFTKINFENVLKALKQAKPGYLLPAVVLFVFSKILNSFRLNLYFHTIGVKLTQPSNLKLYLLGMFYNLFLPGGIGGDAYKGYVIQKKYQSGTKKVISVLLLDRLSGMLLIFIYACILAILLQNQIIEKYALFFLVAIPISVFVFWFLNKRFFDFALSAFWGAFGYSAFIQATQLLAVVCILKSLSITLNEIAYLFVFLVSSIVSVVPLTIGGIGSREVTFLYGSKWLALNSDTSIAISMIFFLITALVSLFGIIYHFRKPELKLLPN